jgi:hypothetical protein
MFFIPSIVGSACRILIWTLVNRNIVSAVKNQFGKEFSGIQASIHDRTTDEQRSILIALLEELETKEHINET